ncbi:lysozyme [Novosphingobium sp.]|uniref:lysozyme n=1 Tax=Novosphingobium sp. TaxID=1874826 RepID=UPI0038B75031
MPSTPPARRCNAAGRAIIQHWEGCAKRLPDGRLTAYPDPGSADGRPWTIGWGSTGPDITRGTIWTQAQADARFLADLERFEREVFALVGAKATDNQFGALVSFQYNTGGLMLAGGKPSGLLRKHRAGDFAGARAEFGRWINNNGKVMPGLVKRRAEEAALYGS